MKISKIILLFFLFNSLTSFACKCKRFVSVSEEYERSDKVLFGNIISKEKFEIYADPNKLKNYESSDALDGFKIFRGTKYNLRVYKTYKGKTESKIITIYTWSNFSECGFPFEIGTHYIVYGHKNNIHGTDHDLYNFPEENEVYWTNRCLRNRKYDKSEIAELEKLKQ